MSLISDLTQLGQKLAASFFDLDDLAAGQGVVREGTSQLAQAGRWGAGAALVSSNLAARTFQLGVQGRGQDGQAHRRAPPTSSGSSRTRRQSSIIRAVPTPCARISGNTWP